MPHDAAAGIETLVEHALGDTVAGIEHVLDLPTPDSLNADTVFGPSYSRFWASASSCCVGSKCPR